MGDYKVKLASAEGDIFDVDPEVAKMSTTIRNMLEDLGMDDKDAEAIPLPNVNSAILRKVIHWGEYHRSDPTPIGEDRATEDVDKRSDAISQWDTEFLKVDQGTLFELILAANYLDIKALLDTCCKSVANMIKEKSVEEIRKTFNIKVSFDVSSYKRAHGALAVFCLVFTFFYRREYFEYYSFDMQNDFTPQEEEAVRKENEWCEDRDNEPTR